MEGGWGDVAEDDADDGDEGESCEEGDEDLDDDSVQESFLSLLLSP